MKINLPFVCFEVTMNCNLRCKFCYNHYKNTGEKPKLFSYKQTKNTLERIFSLFNVGQITFTGGEPFMAERFGELVLAARFKGSRVNVISNGNFATVDKYKQLVDLGVTLFELPIHSYDSIIHDSITRVEGSQQKSIYIIKVLQDYGIVPTVVIVLTKYNAQNIGKTINFIHSLGIKNILFNRYNIGGEAITNPLDILPTKEQLLNAFQEVSNIALKLNLSVFSGVCIPHCILDPKKYPGIKFSSCTFDISRRPVTIDYLGNLRFCNHSPIVLGNIFTDTPQQIFENPLALEWSRVVPQFCLGCTKLSQCKAGCRAASQQCGKGLNMPDPIVDLYGATKI